MRALVEFSAEQESRSLQRAFASIKKAAAALEKIPERDTQELTSKDFLHRLKKKTKNRFSR